MSDDPRVQHHLLSGDVYEITTTADEGLMMRRVDYFAGDTGESTVSASDPVLLILPEQIALVDWLRGHPGMRVCLLTREDAYVYAQERDEHRTTDTAAEGTIIYISRGLIPLLFGPGTDEVRTRVFAQGGLEGVVPPERGDGAAAERTPDALFAADTEPSEAATTRLAEQGGSTETAVTDRIGPASEALFRALVTAGLAGPLSSVSGAAQRLCSGAHVRICVPAEVLLDAPDTLAALARCAGAGEGQTIELVVLGVNKENKDALEALTDPVLRRAVGLDRSVSVHIVGDGELPLPGESVMGNRQWVESVSRMFPAGETDTDTLVITPPLNAPGANELSALMQGGCGQRCSICVPIEAGTGEVLSLARILQQWFVLLDEGRGSPVLVILPVLVPCAELIPELERYRDALWAALSAA